MRFDGAAPSRDTKDPPPERLASDLLAQRPRAGNGCLLTALCLVAPVAVAIALHCVPPGHWVACLFVAGVLVAVPMAVVAWLWSALALDRRVGACPDCGHTTTFLGPCPTCHRRTPGIPALVNSAGMVALLGAVLIGGCVMLVWVVSWLVPDKEQEGSAPPVFGGPPASSERW
jgi:hypothetical protein